MSQKKYTSKVSQSAVITLLKKAVLLEATVSKNDTVVVSEIAILAVHEVFLAADGTAVAHTVASNNVITITEDPCASQQVYIVCIG